MCFLSSLLIKKVFYQNCTADPLSCVKFFYNIKEIRVWDSMIYEYYFYTIREKRLHMPMYYSVLHLFLWLYYFEY